MRRPRSWPTNGSLSNARSGARSGSSAPPFSSSSPIRPWPTGSRSRRSCAACAVTPKDRTTVAAANRRRDGEDGPIGLVVVDKEPGWTSHDVVARCRRLFGQRRVGHAGTLDPDATGILLVGLGRVTRTLRFLTALGKQYEAEVVLGTATSTLDASGDVLETWDMSEVTLTDVRRAAATLTGDIEQIPPMVSAVKIAGRRLHDMARAGLEVDRPPRP